MTNAISRTIAIALSLSFSVASFAQYTSYGVGNKSCGAWVEARRANEHFDMAQWMLGFMSGVGFSASFNLRETEGQAMVVWMDNYCQANPLSQINDGAKDLVRQLRK